MTKKNESENPEDFLKNLMKEVGGDFTKLAKDIEENENYVDTGSYVLNALTSGSIFGGISQCRITALAADESCGKTFIALNVVREFLTKNQNGICLYFDTESAINKTLLVDKGIDINRVVIVNVVTVEEFRSKALKAVDMYLKLPKNERKPLFLVLDSLGMLSTNKEIGDALEEKDTRDMTKASLLKGTFRMLTLKLGEANVPMIVNNHLYDSMSMYTAKKMSGGSGLSYAASSILYISKSKEKEGTEVVGAILKFKTVKSRLSRENRDVEVRLFYDERGLDRYYGLLPLAVEGGIIERVGNRYVFGEGKFYEKEITKNPETFFTQDVLEQIDVYAQKKFKYGSSLTVENEEEETED
jgi:RecA/RadA recombinase